MLRIDPESNKKEEKNNKKKSTVKKNERKRNKIGYIDVKLVWNLKDLLNRMFFFFYNDKILLR